VHASEKLVQLFKGLGQTVLDEIRAASEYLVPSRRLPLLHMLDQLEVSVVEN